MTRDQVIKRALRILAMEMKYGEALTSPHIVKQFLSLKLCALEHEVFCLIYLDAQHNVIKFEEMFRGTLTETSVYPREVAKEALKNNAAAVILAHNHPSGATEPSRADELLTQNIKLALALIGVKVLDHFIVGQGEPTSMAERGLI